MPTHTYIFQANTPEVIAKTVTVTDGQETNIDHTILAGSVTDVEIKNLNFLTLSDATQIKSMILKCTVGNILVETNSGSTPDDSFTMAAGDILFWCPGTFGANPFPTADVTSLFLTGAADSRFVLKSILKNP